MLRIHTSSVNLLAMRSARKILLRVCDLLRTQVRAPGLFGLQR